MTIKVKQDRNFFPLYYEIEDTYYPNEEECLFHPFTFFKLKKYKIDYIGNNLELELEAIGKREILELGLNEKNKLVYDEENNIITYQNGEYYIGQWLNGLKNGRGTIFYRDNNIKYEGDFVNNKFEGKGRYNWENGEYYIGQWSNGLKNGRGTIFYRDNNIKYEGDFVNG